MYTEEPKAFYVTKPLKYASFKIKNQAARTRLLQVQNIIPRINNSPLELADISNTLALKVQVINQVEALMEHDI